LSLVPEPVWKKIPGKVEAEHYNAQFGVQTESTSDKGGGQNVGYINDGDWMEYAVEIEKDTVYTTTFRLASLYGGGIITLYLDDKEVGQVKSRNTGSWQTWESVDVDLKLKKGKHYLKLFATKGGFNINWMQFIQKSDKVSSNLIEMDRILIYPNPTENILCVFCPDFIYDRIELIDLSGKIMSVHKGYQLHNQIEINLTEGNYSVRLSNQKESVVKKISVTNN
jgi:hypothetical protein